MQIAKLYYAVVKLSCNPQPDPVVYCHIIMGYICMCRCEGYGYQAIYSRIGYINQRVRV